MDKFLQEYIKDIDNPITNYRLAIEYQKTGNYSSAITFYLRCKEKTEDILLQYECLIKCAECFRFRGKCDDTIRSLLLSSIDLCPDRPEAYYLISRFFWWRGEDQYCYEYSSLGLENSNFECKSLQQYVEYDGIYNLLLRKAVSSFALNHGQESRNIFKTLFDDYWTYLNETDKNTVTEYIGRFGLTEYTQVHFHYDKSLLENLRYKFPGVESIEKNYSQSYQDMFVLSMLKGKRNGTFLEIGGANPYYGNNTALLEEKFDWTGCTVEIDSDCCKEYGEKRKNTKVFCDDAKSIDYKSFLKLNYNSNVIDYLQLDIEPAINTYDVLLKIPFDEYKFSVITYEHDHYVDSTKTCRENSRKYLSSKGYLMIVNDISNDGISTYEDWWVHPDFIDSDVFYVMEDLRNNIKDVRSYFINNK